jgi:hypothetical protein
MKTRFTVPALALTLLLPALLHAGEILVRTDKDRFVQGESALLSITVRGSPVRPQVTPPTVPYCQIEQVQEMQQHSRTPERGMTKAGGSSSRGPGLAGALQELNKRVQDLPSQFSTQGLGDSGLLREYEGMLQDIRLQAREALQSGGSSKEPKEYQAVYRVTPQRAGTLTVTPFILKIGGQSYLTKPVTLTIDPPLQKQDAGVATAVADAPAPAPGPEPIIGTQGLALKPWHGLLLLAAPVLGILAAIFSRRRQNKTRSHASAGASASSARRTALCDLEASRDPASVAKTLTEFVRRRCQLPEGEITPKEAAESLRRAGVSDVQAERVAMLLDACTAAEFAAGSVAVDVGELAEDARRLVLEI